MITRPLDLASKLRPPPRNFDSLFYVNAGLIILYFFVCGSRFVLAPGFGVEIRLPIVVGANANARSATHVIDVDRSGQMFTNDGRRTMAELEAWLIQAGKSTKDPLLLVRADKDVPLSLQLEISTAAQRAGFTEPTLWAAIDASDGTGQKGR